MRAVWRTETTYRHRPRIVQKSICIDVILINILDGDADLVQQADGDLSLIEILDGQFGVVTEIHGGAYPSYTGQTTVTPSNETQTLNTKDT